MSLKHVDLECALRRLAEKRIEDAMREGKFDNLAGAGKPLDLEPMPADENARMTWWMIRILKNNNFTPEEVTLRRQIETFKNELEKATTEHRVDVLCKTVNDLVRQVNTLGTNAINIAVTGVSVEDERRRLHERLAQSAPEASPGQRAVTARQCATTRCKTTNPPAAQFCRRCGKVLPTA